MPFFYTMLSLLFACGGAGVLLSMRRDVVKSGNFALTYTWV